ncbi:sugar transferase [Lapillicoccus jejuensis]|uniref:Lipopolysaccharide/colanic/teichoic acid biosynthesis glycosyltransferase n=1 Tax=Lapillicoccus jejuensis TaxID=402171 RepID=A0A542DWI3_9MICO|nr:sugar transferase [Lapillicoccus jejuensis]TQJ07274.1 lipopolysaccharide/colanic/teichoic acid biosynthesis glycosyltransferase [Lapillicoccus jejuensis]
MDRYRVRDLVVAVPALVLSTPAQLVVAAVVAARLGRPVLFRQTRAGRHGEPFRLLKFRTMLDVDEAAGLLTDEQRLTPTGRVLRATSLDELPGLWNVVRGDMALVGPRPLLVDYLPLYSPEQARRHEVPPGLTGLAQVSGRNAVGWAERLRLDVEYVDRRSLALDLRLLCRTVAVVLRREGISADGQATMSRFTGDPGRTA